MATNIDEVKRMEAISDMELQWIQINSDGPIKDSLGNSIFLDKDDLLRLFTNSTIGAVDIKGNTFFIPKSYSNLRYKDLTISQKMKVLSFWNALKFGDQLTENSRIKAFLSTATNQAIQKIEVELNTRRKNTTKHEYYRVIQLMDFPDAKLQLSLTRRPLNRQELDLQQSGDDAAVAMLPWNVLADMFNSNHDTFPVKNLAVDYDDDGKIVRPLQMARPFFSYAGSGNTLLSFEGIFDRVKDIDPSIYFRPRDPAWLKERVQEIRNLLAKYVGQKDKGFFKSGFQDGQNILTSWSEYMKRNGENQWADCLILTASGVDFLSDHKNNGKVYEFGTDTGEIGDFISTVTEADTLKRRTQWVESQRRRRDKLKTPGSDDSNDSDLDKDKDDFKDTIVQLNNTITSFASTISSSADLQSKRKIAAATALLHSDDPGDKQKASNYLRNILDEDEANSTRTNS